jgi:hypothetical protein
MCKNQMANEKMSEEQQMVRYIVKWIIIAIALLIALIGLNMYYGPQYNVYQKSLNGQALLQEAQFTREIRVAASKAQLESAENEAKANKILAESLSPMLIQYEWVRAQEGKEAGNKTFVYIPTNSTSGLPMGLPATEATRLNK